MLYTFAQPRKKKLVWLIVYRLKIRIKRLILYKLVLLYMAH